MLLDCLTASGLLCKKNGVYQNSPIAKEFLEKGKDTYLGGFFTKTVDTIYAGLEDLASLVKKGPQGQKAKGEMSDAEFWADFARDMGNYANSGPAHALAEKIAALPEFSKVKRMLDLGGGPGIMGLALAQKNIQAKAVIFDRPEVVKVSKEFIEKYEMSDRVSVLPGDYTKEDLGGKYDLILASCTLNFFKDNLDPLFEKIYEALNPGGLFISFHDGLTHEFTEPSSIKLSMASNLFMGQDFNFERGELAEKMIAAGFKSVRGEELNTPYGPLDLEIGRKE